MSKTRSEEEIPFARPDLGPAESAAVHEALASGWLTTGPRVRRFEAELAAHVGARHAVATNSCTAALHLALAALDPRPGEAVLVPTYNFTSSAEVAQHLGLEPVLVDSEPKTLNVDPEALERRCRELKRRGVRARAVMPVHLAGHPADLEAIDRIAAEFGLAVIEDAAHALPASYQGQKIGSRRPSGQPLAVCYSFYANKTLTTGEGGMLVTDDGELAERCRRLSLHGIDKGLWEREQEAGGERPAAFYEVMEAGYKYNLGDVAAALGLAQLGRVEEMWRKRSEIARRYDEVFADHPALEVPHVAPEIESAWHLYLLRLRLESFPEGAVARDRLAAALGRRGIGTSVHYRPLHLHRHYRKRLGHAAEDFPVASAEWRRVLSLPIYSSLEPRQVERVARAVLEEAENLSK